MLTRDFRDDWQYILPFVLFVLCFVSTDIFSILNKSDFAYWSGGLVSQPYRVFSAPFLHGDIRHILTNGFGIAVARYCLMAIGMKSKILFILLTFILIPIQSFIFWLLDIYIFNNLNSWAIGFSGIIYGIFSFILLASIYGKKNLFRHEISLKKSKQIRHIITVIISVGFVGSLFPGISLAGHFSGLISGALLFVISNIRFDID